VMVAAAHAIAARIASEDFDVAIAWRRLSMCVPRIPEEGLRALGIAKPFRARTCLAPRGRHPNTLRRCASDFLLLTAMLAKFTQCLYTQRPGWRSSYARKL
jgi:hypothetical protein